MVTVKLKGVAKVRAKGQTYYYAWRGGPRLPGEPGSPEFIQAYQDACAPLSRMDKRSFATWVKLFRASAEFSEFAPSTQRVWRPWLDRIEEYFGDLSVRQFDRPQFRTDIKRWRNQWRDTPRTADYAKQVLSRVLAYVVDEGGLRSNPCEGISNLYSVNRSDLIWTEGDLQALITNSSPEIGWAARLGALTGLREGDLLKLRWADIGNNAIQVRTRKSRGRKSAVVPMTAALRQVLSEIPKRGPFVLTNTKCRPWGRGFSSSWNDAMINSGLSRREDDKGWVLHFHDLRGTAATNFYRAGFTVREIAEILAWTEDNVERLIDHYVKRDEILLDRIRRMDAVETGTKIAKPEAKP